MNAYIADILSQADDLRAATSGFDQVLLADLMQRQQNGAFDRIVLTGMGTSLYACHPIWRRLIQAGLPAWMMDAAELLHHGRGLITPRTLLWVVSQSGESAEIVRLLEDDSSPRPAYVLLTTNALGSSAARMADVCVPMRVQYEDTVSSRTYVNTLAVGQLTALALLGQDLQEAKAELMHAADSMEHYLTTWEDHVAQWSCALPSPERLMLVGRGHSMAAVEAGALVLKEVVRMNVEGQGAAEFRHGPIEIADARLGLLVFGGTGADVAMNRNLACELSRLGAKVVWLGMEAEPNVPNVLLPRVSNLALPCLEIVPLELLSVQLAQAAGIEPGEFRHSGKVTDTE